MTTPPSTSLVLADGPKKNSSGSPGVRLQPSESSDGIEATNSGAIPHLTAATGGSNALLESLAFDLATLGGPLKEFADDMAMDAAMAWAEAMEPKDPVEAALLAQMLGIHRVTMRTARRLLFMEHAASVEATERALNRLARTYAAQMEALKRYRSKGQQIVRVERVTVEGGGQAVVGNINTTAEG